MWMDHRAAKEADFINTTSHSVLKYVGGKIFLEMELPKILWLKKNLPKNFHTTKQFLDLGDFLRWRATSCLKRSICCLACKWNYVHTQNGGQGHWDGSYLEELGLESSMEKFGSEISFPGPSSEQISSIAAQELGLSEETIIGFSLIDAHSGVLGMIGCELKKESPYIGVGRLCLISGTSNCHMALSKKSIEVKGVWGPFYGVILNGLHLNEGGQSAAGKLLDYVVRMHPGYSILLREKGTHGYVMSR